MPSPSAPQHSEQELVERGMSYRSPPFRHNNNAAMTLVVGIFSLQSASGAGFSCLKETSNNRVTIHTPAEKCDAHVKPLNACTAGLSDGLTFECSSSGLIVQDCFGTNYDGKDSHSNPFLS
jgi:hypothetical protein